MAQLNMKTRTRIGAQLEEQLPDHWRVTVGAEGHAFIEIDQDGNKPSHKFHAIGSTVIRIHNSEGGMVHAGRYKRVKFPPGYAEGREYNSDVATVNGRGWVDQLITAVVSSAAEADAQLTGAKTAEA